MTDTSNLDLRKWLWPRYGLIFPIDFLASLAIISIACGLALPEYQAAAERARVSEAFSFAGVQRYEIIESLALSGESLDADLGQVQESSAAASGADYETHLAGRSAPTRKPQQEAIGLPKATNIEDAQKAAQQRADQRARDAESTSDGRGKFISGVRVVGTTVIAEGTTSAPFNIGFYPAVADDETPTVYVWLCGRARLPDGLLARAPAATSTLPDQALPPVCRRGRGP